MSKRVLLIDDENDIREVAALSLESFTDWKLFEASSGAEGVAKAQLEQPDAILLDIMMPGMDGPTTFLTLQAGPSTRHIPVIFLTAKVQPADQRRFRQFGVQGVIGKPFDPMRLAAQISETLGW